MADATQLVTLLTQEPSELSAAMHNAGYKHLGLDFEYKTKLVTDLGEAIDEMRASANYRGASVTMPFKEKVIGYLSAIDKIAEDIGAVNTIVHNGDFLTGYNTDWCGAMDALKEATPLDDKLVIIIGAGGAARAIAYGLKINGARAVLFNKTSSRGIELADRFGFEFGGSLDDLRDIRDYHILINATSMAEDSPVPESALKQEAVVMDVVSSPVETKLLQLAKSKGCTTIPGYKMLVHQALPQFRLFTGKEVPFEVMEQAALGILK